MKKRCLAQLSLSGPWGSEHLQPGMEVDLARVLTPAQAAVPAKGDPGTDGSVAARPAVAAFTVADAIAGREDCFEAIAEPSDQAAALAPHGTLTAAKLPPQE